MYPVSIRAAILAVALSLGAMPAVGEQRIAVREVLPANPASELVAKQIQHLVGSELVMLVEKAQAEGSCEAVIVDIGSTITEARATEKKLMDEGYAPKNLVIEELRVGTFIDGVVGIGDGDVTWIMQVTDGDGKLIADDKGFLGEDKVAEAAEAIARSLFDKLCKKKAYRAKGGYNDLTIDHTVCDLTKPFELPGTGASAGILFSLAPQGDGGSFTVGGMAAGVPWSGAGNYTVSLDSGGGAMALTGAWKITTPVGAFGDSGTIKLTLTKAEGCGTEEKKAAPAAKTPPEQKKRKG
ncbi:MAG: hypothetical protein EOS18_04200 [Mesorhizobium sp.]|nr:MAG: hypothetical protein EOS18_04200 [Mesorhizobium sp.]